MKLRLNFAVLLVVLSVAGLTAGQQTPAPAPQSQQPTFKLRVDYVEVDVVVTDRQGNLIRDLKKEDFLRILTEPKHALTKQYAELLATEGVTLDFSADGVEALADIAFEVNRTAQNIGARRLHTILERVVEEISYDGPDRKGERVVIDGKYVRDRLTTILEKEDLSKFIL